MGTSLIPHRSAESTTNVSSCSFFNLPLELREQIYGYLLCCRYNKSERNPRAREVSDVPVD